MSFSMKDNKDQNEILKVTVEDLKSMLTQRPGAQAIKYAQYTLWGVFSEGKRSERCTQK